MSQRWLKAGRTPISILCPLLTYVVSNLKDSKIFKDPVSSWSGMCSSHAPSVPTDRLDATQACIRRRSAVGLIGIAYATMQSSLSISPPLRERESASYSIYISETYTTKTDRPTDPTCICIQQQRPVCAQAFSARACV